MNYTNKTILEHALFAWAFWGVNICVDYIWECNKTLLTIHFSAMCKLEEFCQMKNKMTMQVNLTDCEEEQTCFL